MLILGNRELITVFAKHDPYWTTGHLGKVVAEMKTLGPPTIEVVEWRENYFAVEGSHRLAAAFHLNLIPILKINHPSYFDTTDESFWSSLQDKLPSYSWLI